MPNSPKLSSNEKEKFYLNVPHDIFDKRRRTSPKRIKSPVNKDLDEVLNSDSVISMP